MRVIYILKGKNLSLHSVHIFFKRNHMLLKCWIRTSCLINTLLIIQIINTIKRPSVITFPVILNSVLNNEQGINEAGCPDPTFKQHMISLKEDVNGVERQIFAFEDINYPHGDYDFNDCVFYATGDLYPSCSPSVSGLPQSNNDADGDGIIDAYDDEPNNAEVACLLDYQGTLVFEDLWPNKGDFDFNDLVVA